MFWFVKVRNRLGLVRIGINVITKYSNKQIFNKRKVGLQKSMFNTCLKLFPKCTLNLRVLIYRM